MALEFEIKNIANAKYLALTILTYIAKFLMPSEKS